MTKDAPDHRNPPDGRPTPPTDNEFLDSHIDVTLVLRPREPLPGVADIAARRIAPLQREAFAARYGAAAPDVARVRDFFASHAHGFTITSVDEARRVVEVSGTVRAFARLFDVVIEPQRSESPPVSFHRALRPPTVPAEIADVVRCVFGLDTRPLVLPHARGRHASAASDAKLAALPTTYTADQVARIYEYPLEPAPGLGQTIGLIELAGGYKEDDIHQYLQELGIPGPLDLRCINDNRLSQYTLSNLEVTLDIEIVSAVCPQARIVVYNQNSVNYSIKDFFTIWSRAIHDKENHPAVISNSWGFPENVPHLGIQLDELQAFEDLFATAAVLGITLCSSTGDQGGFYEVAFGGGGPVQFGTALTTAYYPATSAWMLACGGTTLVGTSPSDRQEEVWNRFAERAVWWGFPGNGGASGGGVSQAIDLPDYQQAAGVPVPATYSWGPGGSASIGDPFRGRGVPDVAANGDVSTGYRAVFDDAWCVVGGTSSATPMWACLALLIAQRLGRPIGFITSMLYDFQFAPGTHGALWPIVKGNNGIDTASPEKPWNACTGLGAPIGSKLLQMIGDRLHP